MRELAEELLIETEVDELLATETHEYADRVIHLHFFRCRLLAGVPITVGCDALAWVTPESRGQYAMPPADARFVDSLKTRAYASKFFLGGPVRTLSR